MTNLTSKNIQGLLRQRLPADVLQAIVRIGGIAENAGVSAYLVGGCVRDIFLETVSRDLDIVIEGDVVAFVKRLEREMSLNVKVCGRFATAKARLPGGFTVDIAGARRESYPRPAALPVVSASNINDDLFRRDFIVNTLAVKINNSDFGELLDLFGARNDLQNKQIMVLHDKSFVDDPTRIFRAARFEQRLGFTIEGHTEELILQAKKAGIPRQLTRARVGNEIILILKEKEPLKVLLRIDSLLGLRIVHPEIKLDEAVVRQFQCCQQAIDVFKKRLPVVPLEDWLVYLMILTRRLPLAQIKMLCRDFSLTRSQTEKICSARENMEAVSKVISRRAAMTRSQIYKILSRLSYEENIFLLSLVKSGRAKERIGMFIYELSRLKIRLRGEDLQKLGIQPGPAYREILQRVLYAVIDGRLKSRADEVGYVKKLVRKGSAASVLGNPSSSLRATKGRPPSLLRGSAKR